MLLAIQHSFAFFFQSVKILIVPVHQSKVILMIAAVSTPNKFLVQIENFEMMIIVPYHLAPSVYKVRNHI